MLSFFFTADSRPIYGNKQRARDAIEQAKKEIKESHSNAHYNRDSFPELDLNDMNKSRQEAGRVLEERFTLAYSCQ